MDFVSRALTLGFAVLLMCVGSLTAYSQTAPPEWSSAIDQVVHDACNKTIVFLGEPRLHGFGKVLDFKAELTRRLITQCHFDGFFIESGIYDFLKIEELRKSGKGITVEMIQAGIGGIWANQEVARLIPDLLNAVESGKLTLGGLDDQLGRGTYAQREMASDLAKYLEGDTKERCFSALQRHILWQYSNASPYRPADRASLIGCLDQVEAAASKVHTDNAVCDSAMAASLKRLLSRDFPEPPAAGADADLQYWNGRDRSMYQNFRWLKARMPAHSKIIVWTATVHAAKGLSEVPRDENHISMGSFIHREFGSKAFVLGSSEYSGSYAFLSRPPQQLTIAPDNSLEARAFREKAFTARYFDLKELRKFGRIAARPLGVDFEVANWNEVFDGLVVFREEHPPTVSRR